MVEEMPGKIVPNIQKHFLLADELARKYSCIVFLACMRFETSKRRLQYLTFPALRKCADAIAASWTYSSSGSDFYETELDREFLLDLRELRILLEKEKEHKQYVFFIIIRWWV